MGNLDFAGLKTETHGCSREHPLSLILYFSYFLIAASKERRMHETDYNPSAFFLHKKSTVSTRQEKKKLTITLCACSQNCGQ